MARTVLMGKWCDVLNANTKMVAHYQPQNVRAGNRTKTSKTTKMKENENKLVTATSVSGGKTSAYLMANYPTEYNIFALVRTNDKSVMYPDAKVRQIVSDKIGKEFIGTLEENVIIETILDLEQFTGREIQWVSGDTFEDIILKQHGLPNVTQRYCTTFMKILPMQQWWNENGRHPQKVNIGFRANEMRRAKNMLAKCNERGFTEAKVIIGKSKTGNRNRWGTFDWQKPNFPLINDGIYKDKIEQYWSDKPVKFAYMNNCIGCFHRTPILLKHMSNRHPQKYEWFINQEKLAPSNMKNSHHNGKLSQYAFFKTGFTYEEIKNHKSQMDLFDTDFNECDSGYCGL